MKLAKQVVGFCGILSVLILILSVLVFGLLNPEFSFLEDYISKLGARDEPNALWFNLFGFVVVGILLFIFGLAYGKLLNDTLLSILLSLFGLGFAFTSIPVNMQSSDTYLSKLHIVAICLGLAFWLAGLSRLGYNSKLKKPIRNRANFTSALLIVSMIGSALEIWSMPITHRLVFGIVFGWTIVSSAELISFKKTTDNN